MLIVSCFFSNFETGGRKWAVLAFLVGLVVDVSLWFKGVVLVEDMGENVRQNDLEPREQVIVYHSRTIVFGKE